MTRTRASWSQVSGFLAGALLLIGCGTIVDYGREGIYQLSFQSSRAAVSRESAQQQMTERLRSAVIADGYKVWTGKREFWTKGGSYVEWATNSCGELMLKVHAFGGMEDMRESEQIELELLRLISARSDTRITRLETTADLWK